MVWHNRPRPKLITLVGKSSEILLHQAGDFWASQMTVAPPAIKICFDLFSLLSIVFYLKELPPFGAESGRETVRKAEGDELCQARLVAMWQVTALMPAMKSRLRLARV